MFKGIVAVLYGDLATGQGKREMFDPRVFGGYLLQPGDGGLEARWQLYARQLIVLDALKPQRPSKIELRSFPWISKQLYEI